ncbi:hypothetical protein JKP88DRAFT_160549 [Tribonema minus]|uniref:GH26 domain-containing protein n=1 Tax=Tribonema minus TaxID=303371 RepID=A0A836CL01_9STRA|nr:hypothetical protein JKP88DRAFT_160549 [Tribonema minus]
MCHPIFFRSCNPAGNWYQWGILYGSRSNPKPQYPNTQTRLKDAFKRVIKIFTDNKAPVQFQLNINANNGYDDKTPFATWWPGTVGLSSVAITAYNRACSTPSHQDSKPFRDRFSAAYNQVKALTPLPIWVAETGTTSCKTDKPTWVKEAFRDIALLFPQVVQVTWFLTDKLQEGVVTDWDMHDGTKVSALHYACLCALTLQDLIQLD